jgi:hypothetical protein
MVDGGGDTSAAVDMPDDGDPSGEASNMRSEDINFLHLKLSRFW